MGGAVPGAGTIAWVPPGPDDDERPDRGRSAAGRPGGPRRSGAGRPRSDRARQAGDGPRRAGGPRGAKDGERRGRGQDDRPVGGRGGRRDERPRRDQGERPERGPRPPIKGKRRTFDADSAPNERERRRLEGGPETAPEDRWVDEGPVRRAAGDAVRRGSRSKASSQRTPPAAEPEKRTGGRSSQRRAQRATKRVEGALEIDRERLKRRLGAARAERTLARVGEATAAYAEERYDDARKGLTPIVALIPEEPAVRELLGLSLYRLGRWRKAAEELEEFVRLSGSTEQHPVLADCYRALGQHARVQELWDEIGEESLAAPLVAEGRIVYAGSLADQGRLVDAIAVLEAGSLGTKDLKDHHLRMRYVLGDLNDRVGEHQAARRWFESVARTDPGFFDVQDRLRQL
jgi:Flp pilus assembly protein TadD